MVQLKVRIGEKGQIVIPKIFRESFKLYPNEEAIIEEEQNGVLIRKKDIDVVGKLREIALKINMKGKELDTHHIKKIMEQQYEERARKAGVSFGR
mgnify:CR=1 FL=1